MINALAVALLLVLGGCAAPTPTVASKPAPAGPPPPIPEDAPVCAADVKLCANGRYVARDPDNGCAFARCPVEPHP